VLSAYLNKIEPNLERLGESIGDNYFLSVAMGVESYRANELAGSRFSKVNFEVFLLWLKNSKSGMTYDEHWRSQTTLTDINNIHYDFIGKFENLNDDAKVILKYLKCDIAFPSQKEIKFLPTKVSDKMKKYYNANCYKLVNEIYSEDFINFNYEAVKIRGFRKIMSKLI
jgi:hypothetical protein